MSLSREHKQRRAQIEVDYYKGRIERASSDLKVGLAKAEKKLEDLQQIGFRVTFSEPLHYMGRYHDYSSWGWGSVSGASRGADEAILYATENGVKATKTDLFLDSPEMSKEWD